MSVGALHADFIARALSSRVRCKRSARPLCAEVYGAVNKCKIPLSEHQFWISTDESSPLSVTKETSLWGVCTSMAVSHCFKSTAASALERKGIDQTKEL